MHQHVRTETTQDIKCHSSKSVPAALMPVACEATVCRACNQPSLLALCAGRVCSTLQMTYKPELRLITVTSWTDSPFVDVLSADKPG